MKTKPLAEASVSVDPDGRIIASNWEFDAEGQTLPPCLAEYCAVAACKHLLENAERQLAKAKRQLELLQLGAPR